MIQPDLAPLQPSLDDMEISGKSQPHPTQPSMVCIPWQPKTGQAAAGAADMHWHGKSSMHGQGAVAGCGAGARLPACTRAETQRLLVVPRVPNHLPLAAARGQVSSAREGKPLESRFCAAVSPSSAPCPAIARLSSPGGWLRSGSPCWVVLYPLPGTVTNLALMDTWGKEAAEGTPGSEQ